MPPVKSKKQLSAAEIQTLKTWIAEGAEYAGPLVVHPAGRRRSAHGLAIRMDPKPDRRLYSQAARQGRADALARGRQGRPDPPAEPRPDRPSALDRRGRRLPRRRPRRRLRATRRPPARLAPLRRALGTHLARRRPVRRFRRLREGQARAWSSFYRDWVIQAINRDLPYDRFIVEQIAGDLLPEPDAGPASSPPASCATR